MSEKPTLVYCKKHRTITSSRYPHLPKWCCEVAALEQRVEGLGALCKEVENILGMAHSFANFPSWLEQLEKALASQEEA